MIDIIGAGRVGVALQRRAEARGEAGTLVTRTTGWEDLDVPAGSPIVVCVRNDDLDGVVERTPSHRRRDLVFTQNGMIRPFLEGRGLSGATRGLLFFAVPARGDDLSPGPEGSPFHGPHAAEVVRWLGRLDVPAREVDQASFTALELEKLIWNSAFGLLCQAEDCTVGEVCDDHADELEGVVRELARTGGEALGIAVEIPTLLDSLVAYSRTIPTYRGAVKAWPWRNGWFVARAAEQGRELPVHDGLLEAAGVSRS